MNNNLLIIEYLLQCSCQVQQFCHGFNFHIKHTHTKLNHFGGNINIESARLLAWKHFSGIYPPPLSKSK
jgi:ankyrin repeat protein